MKINKIFFFLLIFYFIIVSNVYSGKINQDKDTINDKINLFDASFGSLDAEINRFIEKNHSDIDEISVRYMSFINRIEKLFEILENLNDSSLQKMFGFNIHQRMENLQALNDKVLFNFNNNCLPYINLLSNYENFNEYHNSDNNENIILTGNEDDNQDMAFNYDSE